MSMARIDFQDLPAEVRAAISAFTGTIDAATTVSGGSNSAIAARLQTQQGAVFVKGIALDHPQARTQKREAAINPHLPRACPRIKWRLQLAGWDLIGFDVLNGRMADFSPGSADLELVIAALFELSTVSCPNIQDLKQATQRWAEYIPAEILPLLAGDCLLHTDMAPDNILIDEEGAHLVDWAWPTRGAAWIDPAVWVIRLIDAGHTAAEAERWASRFPAFRAASTAALNTFADAHAHLWADIAIQDRHVGWKASMARSAHLWSTYRR